MKKVIDNLELEYWEFQKLRLLFFKYDLVGEGFVTRDDLFEKILVEPRGVLANHMMDFIEANYDLSFGDFMMFFYTYCLFEPMQMLKFIFLMFDKGEFIDVLFVYECTDSR